MTRIIGYRNRRPDDAFVQIIVTRFNAGVYTTQRIDKRGVRISDYAEEWMAHRMRLFEQICAPSMRAQTCQNFTWLIICDPMTPKETLERIRMQSDRISICTQNSAYSVRFALRAAVRRALELFSRAAMCWPKHIITSLVDNDDALNVHYAEWVQNIVPEERHCVLSFPRFEVWHKMTGTTIDVITVPNMYISLIETADLGADTVLARHHGNMCDEYPAIRIDKDEQIALCTIHEYNIYNKLEGNVKREPNWAQYGITNPPNKGEQ